MPSLRKCSQPRRRNISPAPAAPRVSLPEPRSLQPCRPSHCRPRYHRSRDSSVRLSEGKMSLSSSPPRSPRRRQDVAVCPPAARDTAGDRDRARGDERPCVDRSPEPDGSWEAPVFVPSAAADAVERRQPILKPLAISLMRTRIAAHQTYRPPPAGYCPTCWHSRGRALSAGACRCITKTP